MINAVNSPIALYELLWFFVLYSFLGWCVEVAYAAMEEGRFVNRGFLNGPVCPIYGFGMVIVLSLLLPLQSNVFFLFIGAMVLTSALEGITGFLLEKVFHSKWWDYSELPFNLHGYICLKFSVLWGLACVLIVDVFHPIIDHLVGWIPPLLGAVLLSLSAALFLIDVVVTVNSITKLNRKLAYMNELAEKLKAASNALGQNISEGILEISEKKAIISEKQEEMQKAARELSEQLTAKYEELASEGRRIHNRLIKAFPGLTSNQYREQLEELRRRYQLHRK